MSAFVVSRAHLDYMLSAALKFDKYEELVATRNMMQDEIDATLSSIGAMLENENRASVSYRYTAEQVAEAWPESTEPYTFDRSVNRIVDVDPVQMLKAIECYAYQACEHDGWERSAAKRWCDKARLVTIYALPGWDAAVWGIAEARR